jgi:hypothetical protein
MPNGDRDLPEVRDGYAPDASTPYKVVRLYIHVLREDDGSNPAAQPTATPLRAR